MLCRNNLLTHSLEEVSLEVKSPGFTMPQVVQRQRAQSKRAVFIWLYQISDENGVFTLNANKIATQTGLSRTRIYTAIRFLKKVNLLRCIEAKTGRGNHSIYQLNWRKPRKCAALSIKDIKTLSLRKDKVVKRQKKFQGPRGRMMKAFRKLLDQTFMVPKEKKLCMGVIGRFIRGRPIEYCRTLYQRLVARVRFLEPPNWVLKFQDLCRWFWGILKGVSLAW